MCPKGDDPLTINRNHREIILRVHSDYTLSGSLGVEYNGETSILSLTSPSSTNCRKALQTSNFMGDLACAFREASTTNFLYNITFYNWPTFPKENNFHVNNGNPAITDFYCDVSQASSGVYCTFTDVVTTDLPGELYLLFLLFSIWESSILCSQYFSV